LRGEYIFVVKQTPTWFNENSTLPPAAAHFSNEGGDI
jgi:hypothetical protein